MNRGAHLAILLMVFCRLVAQTGGYYFLSAGATLFQYTLGALSTTGLPRKKDWGGMGFTC